MKQPPSFAASKRGSGLDKAKSSAAGFDHRLVKPAVHKDIERLLASIAAAWSPIRSGHFELI